MKFLQIWKHSSRKSLKGLVLGYQWTLAFMLGGQCRFWPSCSDYALQALEQYKPMRAICLIARRLLSCHPFHPGGVDLVPVKLSKVQSLRSKVDAAAPGDFRPWTIDLGPIQ